MAGIVTQVGEDVTYLKVGDRIAQATFQFMEGYLAPHMMILSAVLNFYINSGSRRVPFKR